MSALRTPAEPEPEPVAPAGNTPYYRDVLHGLIEIGADLARMIHDQAKAAATQPDPAPLAAATAAFERVARSMRRSVNLARILDEPVPGRTMLAHQQRIVARAQIIREVEDAIHRRRGHVESEALRGELFDRLDAPDLDSEIALRPIADIIADISHDLGLIVLVNASPWKRRLPADIAALRDRAAQPPPNPGGAGQSPIRANLRLDAAGTPVSR